LALRKLLTGSAGLIVLLVATALIVPSFIDWTGYKGRITAAIEDATGLSLAIDGDIGLTVLPSPTLAVSGLRIVGAGNFEFIQLPELRVKIGIRALLEGRIDVASVTLVKPLINLQIDENGASNWSVVASKGGSSGASGGGQSDSSENSDPAGFEFNISLSRLLIEDGSLRYRDLVGGHDETIDQINALVSATSLEGPFKVEANVTIRGQQLDVTLMSGRIESSRPISLDLVVKIQEPQTTMQFAGTVSALTNAGQLNGKLSAKGTNVGKIIAKHAGFVLPQFLSGEYSIETVVSASGEKVVLSDASLQLGESRANVSFDAQFGELLQANLAVMIANLNLDTFTAQAPATGSSSGAVGLAGVAFGTDQKAEQKTESAGDQSSEMAPFELPSSMTVNLNFGADVVQFRSGIIRDATLKAILRDGTIVVEQASAGLPGASSIALSGVVQPVEGKPQFDGALSATSDNLRGITDWLKIAPGVLPAGRLRNFSYKSLVKATPDALEISDINVELDATKFTGGLAVALRDRLAFGLRLDVDKFNLDPYLVRATDSVVPASSAPVKSQANVTDRAAENTSDTPGSIAFLDTFDANLDLRVGRLSVGGLVAEKVRADTTLVGGSLTIREASVGKVAGITSKMSGSVELISTNPTAALTFAVSSGDIEALGRLVGASLRVPKEVKHTASINGQLNGGLSDMVVKATVDVLGGMASVEGTIKNLVVDPTVDLGLAVNHPELGQVLKIAAPDYRPAASNLGPLAISLRVAGTQSSATFTALKGNAGPIAVQGDGSFKRGEKRPYIKANIATSELLLDLVLPIGTAPGARGSTQRTSATTGTTSSATGGSGAKSTSASRSEVSPALSFMTFADVELNGRMAALSKGRIRLDNPQFHLILKDGRLNVDRFTANAFGGVFESTLKVDSNHRDPRITSTVVAKDIQVRDLSKVLTDIDRVEGSISTAADFSAEGLTAERLLATLNGKGSVSGQIRVLTTEEEKTAAVAGSLIGTLLGNKVREIQLFTDIFSVMLESFGNRPAKLSGDYVVASGVVRSESVVLDGGSARAVTRGSADLPAWKIDAVTSVYQGEGTEPFVTATLSGPLDAPNIKLGGSALKPSNTTTQVNPLEKLLSGLLGGTLPKPSEKQSGQPQNAPKPEEILKNLLKGLGGG
jgi:uncharacterized protein involved in outer membrane biogenesis